MPSALSTISRLAVSGKPSVKLPAVLLAVNKGSPAASVAPKNVVPNGTAPQDTRSGVVARINAIEPDDVRLFMSITINPRPTFSFVAVPPMVCHERLSTPTDVPVGMRKNKSSLSSNNASSASTAIVPAMELTPVLS